MPRYTYQCDNCEEEWIERGNMNSKPHDCQRCGSADVKRRPSPFSVIKKDNVEKTKKVGEVTQEYIEAAHEDLKEMKGDLETTEYKSDD